MMMQWPAATAADDLVCQPVVVVVLEVDTDTSAAAAAAIVGPPRRVSVIKTLGSIHHCCLISCCHCRLCPYVGRRFCGFGWLW